MIIHAQMGIKKTVYDPRNVRNDVADAMIFHGTSSGARTGEDTGKISADWEGVAAGVGNENRKHHAKRCEDHAGARTWCPVLIEDRIVEVPHVPIALAQDASCCCRRSCAQEHDQDFADQDADALTPGDVVIGFAVSSNIRLIDENWGERSHDRVDGLYHGPDKVGA
jgi:hypothetical protein